MTRWALVKRFKGVWDIVKTKDGAWVLFEDHEKNAASQRQIVDEQVEENRGLRNDVLLMQKVNAEQRARIEQQVGVIQRQWGYIARLKQTISVHEQAGLEGLVRDCNDHQRIEQQVQEIERLWAQLSKAKKAT